MTPERVSYLLRAEEHNCCFKKHRGEKRCHINGYHKHLSRREIDLMPSLIPLTLPLQKVLIGFNQKKFMLLL